MFSSFVISHNFNSPFCNWICFVFQRASSSCLESCEFLTKVKNFSSLTNGDNSSAPTPGIPSVTNRSLNSISLKWEAVQNTTGSPVYMIEMAFFESGRNVFRPVYLSEVDWIKSIVFGTFILVCLHFLFFLIVVIYSPSNSLRFIGVCYTRGNNITPKSLRLHLVISISFRLQSNILQV